MQAASVDDLRQRLSPHGISVSSAQEIGAGSSPTSPQTTPATTATTPAKPSPAPSSASPYNYQAPKVASSLAKAQPQGSIVHTVAGTDKERLFLFSQLAAALRAGINPAQAFTEVSQRTAGAFRPSLEAASSATTRGEALSDVLARYPDLYPEHVIGVIKAGEQAGFLPDALEEVARQAESAHAFKRWFFWVWFLAVNFLLSIPGMWITTRAMLSTWDRSEQTGGVGANGEPIGTGEATGQFMTQLWHAFLWPWGPITLLCWGLIWLFRRYFSSRFAKRMRHRLGIKVPVYGVRARHENLQRFAWTMSRVSRAGIAPARAWQLAADSVPNLEFREMLSHVGTQLTGAERMSDIVFRSRLFPEEYAPMVATAEYTGDLPGALQRLSDVSGGEFVAAQNYAKMRSGCWGALGCFITSAIMLGILFWAWYHELPAKVLKDEP